MATEPLRVITDRWEWSSIAQLVPTVYHEQSWTLATVARLRTQFSVAVGYCYARVWVEDTLVGCPLVRLGDRWFNAPRAVPLVLRGVRIHAAAALERALAGHDRFMNKGKPMFELHDDSDLVDGITRDRLLLEANATSTRRYRALGDRELARLPASRSWRDGLRDAWRSGDWTTELLEHWAGDDRIGYTCWAFRTGHPPECIAALVVGADEPAWTVSR